MTYPIKSKYISMNRSHKSLKPIGIVLHETATPNASAQAEIKYFNSGDRGASAHAFVDADDIIIAIPFTEKAWHACEPANSKFIGVEMCNFSDKTKFEGTYKRAVWFFANTFVKVLKITKVTKDNLMSHDEVSKKWHNTTHTDPVDYFRKFGKTVDEFRNDVQLEINKMINPVQSPKVITYPKSFKAVLITDNVTCKDRASNSGVTNGKLKKEIHDPLTVCAYCKNEGYTWYRLSTGQWIVSKFVKIIK